MKVIHIITALTKGGAETHLYDLIREQVKNGYQIKVIFLHGSDYWQKPLEQLNVEVFPLRIKSYYNLFFEKTLKKVIESFGPDLVHSHLGPGELYGYLGVRGTDVPFVISKHNRKRFAPIPFGEKVMQFISRRADNVIAISNSVKETFGERGIDIGKIRVVYYALRMDQFANLTEEDSVRLRREWGVADGEIVFGFVGRLVPEKSINTLLTAYSIYRKNATKNSHLIIAGDGELKEPLVKLSAELKVNARFLGFRSDIPQLMKAYDVFVLSSVTEGFGLVLLEAMAARTAIITTSVGAIPEVVDQSAIMVKSEDPEAMAAAMTRMEDEQVRRDFEERGNKRLMNTFSLQKMFSETETVYHEAIRKRRKVAGPSR
jgi:glycosyltransferase involved in cell wall biosynthesis